MDYVAGYQRHCGYTTNIVFMGFMKDQLLFEQEISLRTPPLGCSGKAYLRKEHSGVKMVQLDDSKDEPSDNTKTVCDIAVPDDTREEINNQEEISVTSADDSGDHSSEINDLSDD